MKTMWLGETVDLECLSSLFFFSCVREIYIYVLIYFTSSYLVKCLCVYEYLGLHLLSLYFI